MSGLIIDSEACIGCGRCVRACASGGIFAISGITARVARLMPCGPFLNTCVSKGTLFFASAAAKSSVFITGTQVSSAEWHK